MLLLGIVFLAITGSSWVLTGIVAGRMPKEGIDTSFYLVLSSLLSIVILGVVMLCTGLPKASARDCALVAACMFFGGVVNNRQLVDMSQAMQYGPNGIIWSIVQCGCIIPFIVGVVFFHTPLHLTRLAGIISLMAALLLMGILKGKNSPSNKLSGNWKLPSFRAFVWTGLTQTLTSLPSYFDSIGDVGTTWRIFWVAAGIGVASPVFSICEGKGRKLIGIYRKQLFIVRSWLYAIGLKLFGFFVSFSFQYPGLDILARSNAGAVSNPLMVGSCIIVFELYALIFLHEKRSPMQFAALLLCLAGTVAICL